VNAGAWPTVEILQSHR
jgi:hypothetical protein